MQSFPPRLRGVEEMTNRLLSDRDVLPVGKRWARNFDKRHEELDTFFFSKYDSQQAKFEDPTIIYIWFRPVQNTIAKYGIHSDYVYIFVETGVLMGMIACKMAVILKDESEDIIIASQSQL